MTSTTLEKQLTPNIRKETGSHFTPKSLASFVAAQVKLNLPEGSPIESLSVLDPAVGGGELLEAISEAIDQSKHNTIELTGYDINSDAVKLAQERFANADRCKYTVDITTQNFIETFSLDKTQSDSHLFKDIKQKKYDCVIANPPYVRTQTLGEKQAQLLAQRFGLTGRIDLYHAFIEAIAQVLKPGGIAGLIVSNRFMTTKTGFGIRNSLQSKFDILRVWDLGDTQLFDAAVLPAVLILRRKRESKDRNFGSKFSSIYSTNDPVDQGTFANPIDALAIDGVASIEGRNFRIRHGILKVEDVWRIETDHNQRWLETIQAHTYCKFKDIGKIRVGVKTTADKVFIRSDWKSVCKGQLPETLKPLTTHHISSRFRIKPSASFKQILYTHEVVNGRRRPIHLEDYPNTAKYLKKHEVVLRKRKYVAKAKRAWYEIWVPQDPNVWVLPKVVFRDITETPTFWMDLDNTVINGDCYWMTYEKTENMNLLWLVLAVANSSFIEAFYDCKFNNKLYSGRRRFMTQYVEEFPLPNPESRIARQLINLAKARYEEMLAEVQQELERNIETLVWKSFGLAREEVSR